MNQRDTGDENDALEYGAHLPRYAIGGTEPERHWRPSDAAPKRRYATWVDRMTRNGSVADSVRVVLFSDGPEGARAEALHFVFQQFGWRHARAVSPGALVP